MGKIFSFGIMYISIVFLVVWVMIGDWCIGGVIVLVEFCVNIVVYYFYEKVWKCLKKGKELFGGSGGMLIVV